MLVCPRTSCTATSLKPLGFHAICCRPLATVPPGCCLGFSKHDGDNSRKYMVAKLHSTPLSLNSHMLTISRRSRCPAVPS